MEISKVKKTCPNHEGVEIKYICKLITCTAVSNLACAECVLEGPHNGHDKIKIDDFKLKLIKILQ